MTGKVNEPEWMRALGRKMDAAATWDEAQAIMHSDPNWVAMMEEKERERQVFHAELARAEAPLLAELRSVGIDLETVADFEGRDGDYDQAIPILLEHFERNYPDETRARIARALGGGSDKAALWPILVDLFESEPPGSRAKDELGISLGSLASKNTIEALINIADDERHGESRVALIWKFSRSRRPEAFEALERYADDPVLGREATAQLKRRRKGK